MMYTFTLLDTANNKLVQYNENFDWEDESLMLFQWLENNYSCDCNRRLFMYNDDISSYRCGSEVLLLQIKDNTGKIIKDYYEILSYES